MNALTSLLGLRYEELAAVEALKGVSIPEVVDIGDRSYVELTSTGTSLVFSDDGVVLAVQLHAQGHEGYEAYKGAIPGELTFSMNRRAVRALLGNPTRSGEAQDLAVLEPMPPWDRFALDGCNLHVEYAPHDAGIRLITLTAQAED